MYGSCLSSLGVINSREIDRMFLGDSMNIMMIVDGFMLCPPGRNGDVEKSLTPAADYSLSSRGCFSVTTIVRPCLV